MKWISEWLFKEHIENMVEEKFQEKLLENYNPVVEYERGVPNPNHKSRPLRPQ